VLHRKHNAKDGINISLELRLQNMFSLLLDTTITTSYISFESISLC
jgi:hypothetical protein